MTPNNFGVIFFKTQALIDLQKISSDEMTNPQPLLHQLYYLLIIACAPNETYASSESSLLLFILH
ncbi:MAG: hypothetical protein EBY16_05700 [Gammaproteobacteria bacterium]|nr:hypothetical protein [Gammaproteobacteria bacterium]